MATAEERLRRSSRMQRRMSDEASCVDLYADVERNFRASSSPRPGRSRSRSSTGKDNVVSSRSVRSSNSPVPKKNSPNSSRTEQRRKDSMADFEGRETPTAGMNSKLLGVTRKDSLKSESSDGTKPIEFEYEVSPDDSPLKSSIDSSEFEKLKNNNRRSVTPRRSEVSQHSSTIMSGSLKGKISSSNSGIKELERKSTSERGIRATRNRSRTSSQSPKPSSKSCHSSNDLREHLKEQEKSLKRNSFREHRRSQNEEKSKNMERSKSKDSTRSKISARSKSRSRSFNREQNERSSHKLNSADGKGSQSATLSNDSPRSTINVPPALKKQTSEKARKVWSSSMGYVSRSSPTLKSSETSQRDVKEKSKKTSSEKEKAKPEKQKKVRQQKTPDKPDKTKKRSVPLTTKGWRAQLAAKFGREPSQHGSTKNRGRIPSTLVFDGSQHDEFPDDISEIP